MKKNWKIHSKLSGNFIQEFYRVRGIQNEDLDQFISPIHPKEISLKIEWKIEEAKKLILDSIQNEHSIVIHGDYDVDGVTATAILYKTIFNWLGYKNCHYFIPDRFEDGYGLSNESVDKIDQLVNFSEKKLLITVDCGITAVSSCEYAKSKGFKVLISDHHQKPEVLPNPDVILWSDKLTGAGISFALSALLVGAKRDALVLALLGTIADLQPLLGLNRSIVKYGLKVFPESTVLGLNKLLEVSGLSSKSLSTYDVGWVVAPRLNASGRLESAISSLKLLTLEDEKEVSDLAIYLNQVNAERQKKTLEAFVKAKSVVNSSQNILLVQDTSFHEGVIGLVAGRLAQEYYRPSIVLSIGESTSKGSCRSIEGVNIIEILRTKSELFENVGGHPMAAGFTILNSRIPELAKLLEEEGDKIPKASLVPTLKVDFEVDPGFITLDTVKIIKDLEPFGVGNQEPIFALMGARIFDAKRVGAEGKHIKFKVQRVASMGSVDAIFFNGGAVFESLDSGKAVDLAFNIKENSFNGNTSVNIHIKDIRQ